MAGVYRDRQEGEVILVVKNIGIEGPGLWEGVMEGKGVKCRVIEASEEEVPPDPDPYSHVLILGGPMSANEKEKYPFLSQEIDLIKNCINMDKPCWGCAWVPSL
jgi:GMP synthase (glutamine-hydrolysing)